MSNSSKDHTSIHAHASSGGQSNNIFGTSESEQSNANKKKNMASNIFGSSNDNAEPAPVKQTRNAGANIFAPTSEETNPSAGTLAGQYKQTQMKSNIFGTDEPTSARHVSDKNKSNIFGIGDNDQNKTQGGTRQGRRDPNASRMGYNPINGEAYSNKDNANAKQPDSTVKTTEEEKGNGQAAPTNDNVNTENGSAQAAPTNSTENGSAQAAATNTAVNGNAQKPVEKVDNAANGDNAQKNVHTSVRVFHPPGGKSNGPLW
jgi:hypothetical protein